MLLVRLCGSVRSEAVAERVEESDVKRASGHGTDGGGGAVQGAVQGRVGCWVGKGSGVHERVGCVERPEPERAECHNQNSSCSDPSTDGMLVARRRRPMYERLTLIVERGLSSAALVRKLGELRVISEDVCIPDVLLLARSPLRSAKLMVLPSRLRLSS